MLLIETGHHQIPLFHRPGKGQILIGSLKQFSARTINNIEQAIQILSDLPGVTAFRSAAVGAQKRLAASPVIIAQVSPIYFIRKVS